VTNSNDEILDQPFVSRRSLIGGASAGAAALAFGAALLSSGARAQDEADDPADLTPGEDATLPTGTGPALPPEYTDFAADWPVFNGDITSKRVATSAISSENIGELGVAWSYTIDSAGYYGTWTSPALIQGETIYVQDLACNVHALERETGAVKWIAKNDVPTVGPNGLAVAYGMVFGATGVNREAFGLNAETGEEVWRNKLSPNNRERIDGAPSVYNNTVYVSTCPAYSGGARGIVYALDCLTGDVLWYFDTTGNNVWGAPRLNAGGGLWYPISFDDDGNLYFGTGNPSPVSGSVDYPNGSSRDEENAYASSMVSLDAITGGVRWYYNDAPHDLFDLDFQMTPILGTINDAGQERKVAIGAGKTGHVVACDAVTGSVVWKKSVGKHQNSNLEEIPEGEITYVFPGTLGGVETPMALDGSTLYVPVVNWEGAFTPDAWGSFASYEESTGELVALDANSGAELWKVEIPMMQLAGATVANDLVFTGDLRGVLGAYLKTTGEKVWEFQATAGVNAPPSIAGDLLLIPAGGPLVGELEGGQTASNQLVALRIGAITPPVASPVASPTA
jgi:outer membrane protein assembly factor BamB